MHSEKSIANEILTTPSNISLSVEFFRNFPSTTAKSSMDLGFIPGISFKSERISAMSASVKYSLDSLLVTSPAGALRHT